MQVIGTRSFLSMFSKTSRPNERCHEGKKSFWRSRLSNRSRLTIKKRTKISQKVSNWESCAKELTWVSNFCHLSVKLDTCIKRGGAALISNIVISRQEQNTSYDEKDISILADCEHQIHSLGWMRLVNFSAEKLKDLFVEYRTPSLYAHLYYVEWTKYQNNFQEHDFLRDLNFVLVISALRSKEKKCAKFKSRKKTWSWNLF